MWVKVSIRTSLDEMNLSIVISPSDLRADSFAI